MAANPTQPSQDLTTPAPYVPTTAEVEHRLAQLQSLLPQRKPNPHPPPTPEQPEPPPAASPQPPTHPQLDQAALHGPASRWLGTNRRPTRERSPGSTSSTA